MARYRLRQVTYGNKGMESSRILCATDSIDELAWKLTKLATMYDISQERGFMSLTYVKEVGYCYVKCEFNFIVGDKKVYIRVQNT